MTDENTTETNPSSPDAAPVVCGVDAAADSTADSSVASATGAAEVAEPVREIKQLELTDAQKEKLAALFAGDETDAAALEAGVPLAPPTPGVRVIICPAVYYDLENRQITVNKIVSGAEARPTDFADYVANISVPVAIMQKDPRGGPAQRVEQRVPLNAVIEASSLEEAFDKYDAAAEKAANAYLKELRSQHQRAVLASGINPGAAAP